MSSLLVSGITGWRSCQEGNRYVALGLVHFVTKEFPFEMPVPLKALEPLAQQRSWSVQCLWRHQCMHKPCYCLTATAELGIAVSSVAALPVLPLLLPSPASPHPRRATLASLSLLDFQKQLFGFGFWCCRKPCFSVTRENTEACKRRIWQLDTAWTALSVFMTPAV